MHLQTWAKVWSLAAVTFSLTPCLAGDILTADYDNARTLSNPNETILNTSNVNVSTFGKLFTRTLDADVFAQPLYLQNVPIKKHMLNVVYIADAHNTVYAFDADNATSSAPLWSVNLGPYDTPSGWTSGLGILSTPVIIGSRGAIYVVAATNENGHRVYRLHALNLRTGAEEFGGPVIIAGQVPGSAPDGQNGVVTFNPDQQVQRTALAYSAPGGSVYFAFASDRDHAPYHGWIFGYNTSTLQQTAIFNASPNGSAAGVWQSGRAPAVDEKGNLYYQSGNGDFDGIANFGESFLKLSPNASGALALADWFTPSIWREMNTYDYDLGSTGPFLLPGTRLLVGGAKTGTFYLLSVDNLGHLRAGSSPVQSFTGTGSCAMPLVFQGCLQIMGQAYWYSAAAPTLYVWGVHDQLKAYQFSNGRFNTTPVSTGTSTAYYPGGVLAVSSNSSTAGTGIVWAITNDTPDQGFYFGPGWIGTGTLHAFSAADLTQELWNSDQNVTRDALGTFASFTPPLVVGGKVYAPTFSNQLAVYGLLGRSTQAVKHYPNPVRRQRKL